MDGMGYWVFLLILYGLSAFMKKRRQTVARHDLDQEEGPEPKSQFASKEEIFKELFGGKWMEENDPDPIPVHQQEPEYLDSEPQYYEEPIRKAPESIPTHGKFDSHISGIPEHEETFNEKADHVSSLKSSIDTFVVPGKEDNLSANVPKITDRTHASSRLVEMLKNKNAIKHSMMLREILDKPRAMRRNIR